MLKRVLTHPLTHGLDLDDPRTTILRRRIIKDKLFLRNIYQEWYSKIRSELPFEKGLILELGSGAGFLAEWVPDIITSDLIRVPGLNAVLDAQSLPFVDGGLNGIVMCNVLHHLPRVGDFIKEAARCIRASGVVVMIEPWVTYGSKLIYQKLHHEPFDPDAADWSLEVGGALSTANGALPWIVFERDRVRFENEFPEWRIVKIEPFMPFRYLLSGGVSMRSFMPGWTFRFWRSIEYLFAPWVKYMGMFALITLKRNL